jgi:hypothetical protein
MKPVSFLAYAAVFLALLGLAGHEALTVRQQSRQLVTLRERAAQLAAEEAALRRQHEAEVADLAAAERQLAALPPARADAPGDTAERRKVISAWLARVKKLRRWFDEHADQRIPEMRFLTDEDWLRVTQHTDLESDEERRAALAAIRNAAERRFLPQLSAALGKLVSAAPPPATTVAALRPFFDPPIEATILDRYELALTTEGRPQWRVQTKAPLDPEHDLRSYATAQTDGLGYVSGSTPPPWAWTPGLREQTKRAYDAYYRANKGTSPPRVAEALPFFDPPLAPAVAEKLLKAERDRQR